jgi:translation initiation factor 2-alpha kinase 3
VRVNCRTSTREHVYFCKRVDLLVLLHYVTNSWCEDRANNYAFSVNILFERSGGEVLGEEFTESQHEDIVSRVPHASPNSRRRRDSNVTTTSKESKRSTVHSVGDDDIETRPYPESAMPGVSSLEQISEEFPAITAEPQLTLHIQMSLHPLSLADFLSTQTGTSANETSFRHCFHPQMSLQILLAILDGVQYLHDCGVVHRDLKPSNIFLSLNRSKSPACVDLSRCMDCKTKGDSRIAFLNVRLGDFGLVAEIAQPDTEQIPAVPSRAVGTELYRPMAASVNADEKLDVFALGIIAMELLFPFDTRMERQQRLQSLRNGHISDDDFQTLGGLGNEFASCIRGMTCEEKSRFTCAQARERIEQLVAKGTTF